jgi:hypothetical protein
MKSKCIGCRDDVPLPFEFEMAFQPIVDVANHRVWGFEALVRGVNGESAFSILNQLTDETLPVRPGGSRHGDKDRRRTIRTKGLAVID